ncbi:hypothetical protein LguiB_030889 [Lonicera macranthoides]
MATEPEQTLTETPIPMVITLSKYSDRVLLKTLLGRSDGGLGLIGERVVIGGWVKSAKEVRKEAVPAAQAQPRPVAGEPKNDVTCVEVLQSRIPFIRSIMKVLGGGAGHFRDKLEFSVPRPPTPSTVILQVSDGSCVSSLQILVDSSLFPPSQVMPTGTCILAEGILQHPLVHVKHVIELKTEIILHVGTVDQDKYPLSKKRLPLEMLRDRPHFRPRTTTVASVMRIRNSLTQATHTFFQNEGFLNVQVPVITTTDTEGFSEKFQVTTLFSKDLKKEEPITMDDTGAISLEAVKASIIEKSKQVEELKRTDSNKEALAAAIQDLHKTNELVSKLEAREKSKLDTYIKAEKFKFSEDFFGRQAYLTVSGSLHLESLASALGNVYSFGPTFRAGRTESKKMLAEMWMVEAEMAFSQLEDSMNCADDFLKFLSKWVLENCDEDLAFVSKRIDKTIVDRLQLVMPSSFEKITYAEAVEVLKQLIKFISLFACSYLVDEIYKRPVIIYNYPKELKPFYVRLNDDGKTVAAFDLVVPKVGTLIRGSQNEERLDTLTTRIKELGLENEQYQWYLDLRRHGSVKNSGFRLVFDLMVLYTTGLNDVRDVAPFPRSCGKAFD